MKTMYGIELSEDEVLMAEDMGLESFLEEEMTDMFGEGGKEEVKEFYLEDNGNKID